jgi:hypothetical protein
MAVAGQIRSGAALPAAQPPAAPRVVVAAGVLVEFTTPILAGSRVRLSDANTLEVVISGIGGSGQFVVPLDHLDKAVTLTVHDRALCGEIMKRNAHAPEEVRRIVLAVAEMGLGGRKAAQAARQAMADEQTECLMTTACLLRRLVAQGGKAAPAAARALLACAGAGADACRELVAAAARAAHTCGDGVYAAIEEWGAIVAPVGVPDMPVESRMRRLSRQLLGLASELRDWAEDDVSPIAANARELAQQVERIAARAVTQVAAIDAPAAAMLQTLPAWRRVAPELRKAVDSLAWILNGWATNLGYWREAAHVSRDDQIQIVAMMFAMTCQHREPMPANRWRGDDLRALQRDAQNAQLHKDWKTGPIDFNAVHRLELAKQVAP